jgi:formylglycine-generating enzyme
MTGMRHSFILCTWLSGCSSLLDLERAQLPPESCASTAECASDQICDAERCVSNVCSAQKPSGCRGLQSVICSAGSVWQSDGLECENLCSDGNCRTANSCALTSPRCGAPDRQCCKAASVPGGQVELYTSNGLFVPRSVSSFAMNELEVTVGRFKQFMQSYDALDIYGSEPWPAPGMGANSHVPGSGWRAEFHERRLLPRMQSDVRTAVLSTCTQDVFDDDQAPMRCVDWYLAWAFCIWDGGRLPTEAEWTYAATGGETKRLYPWSDSALEDSIAAELAVYSDDESNRRIAPAAVGTHHDGRGFFGHEDMAGNVSEWVADDYEPDPPEICRDDSSSVLDADRDCLASSQASRRVVKGGDYGATKEFLKNTSRGWLDPELSADTVGFRCAHD